MSSIKRSYFHVQSAHYDDAIFLMHIQSFKVFSNLAETSSFSKSAQMNGITQSAVSQQVRALERRFRVKLIERGRKHFSLTPEGKAFLQASHQILDILENVETHIHHLQNLVAGELRISTIFSIGLHELPPYLKLYRAAHPQVDVRVRVSPLVGSLFKCLGRPRRRRAGCLSFCASRSSGDKLLERPSCAYMSTFASALVRAPHSALGFTRRKVHCL